MSVRVSPLETTSVTRPGSALAIVRGETVSPAQKQFTSQRRGPGTGQWATLFALLLVATLAWSSILRGEPRAAGLRQHMADALLSLLLVAASTAILLLTQLSLFALPIGAVAYLSAYRNSRRCAVAVAVLCAVAIGSMVPGAPAAIAIIGTQAVIPALFLRRRSAVPNHLAAAALAACASFALYALLYFAAWNGLPTTIQSGLASWLCAGLGPFVALLVAAVLSPLYAALRGDTTSRTLGRLEKLSQPLLRDLAQKAPGSWQHSLAMAKLAEAAGHSIGADTQLLRVGAYYHDIGKVHQPRFFIENIPGTERSVHESVSAIDSCNGIVGHVSKGVELGRRAGLPEQVLDFVRTHHGQGLLEYFWTKEQLSDDHATGTNHTEADFRYPGYLPNTPETGILCICDAIEGATRPLRRPSPEELSDLVHHIVFGKVRTGQLAHSGLSLKDLQHISRAITAALQAAHAPVERKLRSSQESSTEPGRPRAARPGAQRPSIAGLSGIRLDSHDRPSNAWRLLPKSSQSGRMNSMEAHAATESLTVAGTEDTALAVDSDTETTADLAEVRTEDLSEESTKTQELSDETAKRPDAGSEDDEDSGEGVSKEQDEHEDEDDRAYAATRGLRGPNTPPRSAERRQKPEPSEELEDKEDSDDREDKPEKADSSASSELTRPKSESGEKDEGEKDEGEKDEGEKDEGEKDEGEKDEASGEEAVASKPANRPSREVEIPAAEMPLLLTDLKRSGPPTPPPSRRNTIPLGKDELLIEPAKYAQAASRPSQRADSQDGLRPGEMVIGAPPATHPERGKNEEKTALRPLPVPAEARRPEDRITEEQLALVPPASWGDPTAPTEVDPHVELTKAKTDRPGAESGDD